MLCSVNILPHTYLLTQSLISRNYRGDVDMAIIDKFLPMVLDAEEEGTVSPILVHEKVTFVYIKHNNLYCILDNMTAMEVVITKCLWEWGGGTIPPLTYIVHVHVEPCTQTLYIQKWPCDG